jgi:hypothetical protein
MNTNTRIEYQVEVRPSAKSDWLSYSEVLRRQDDAERALALVPLILGETRIVTRTVTFGEWETL